MKSIREVLLIGLLLNCTSVLTVEAGAAITSCAPHTLGAFSLETDADGRISKGEIGLIYKNYRKCDLSQENTRVVKEFGEYVIKGECIGTAKLLYDRVNRLLYAIEPEGNRKIGIGECRTFAHDVDGERLIKEMRVSIGEAVDGNPSFNFPALEQKAVDKLFAQARQHCLGAGLSGQVRTMSALVKSSGLSGHFGHYAVGRAESIFMCD